MKLNLKMFELKFKVTDDTEYIQSGSTFFAFVGKKFNGIDFISQAISFGATKIIIDQKNINNVSEELINDLNFPKFDIRDRNCTIKIKFILIRFLI